MARKRVNGRFAREDGDAGTEERVDGDERAGGAGAKLERPRPRNCRAYTRGRLAKVLPEVTEVLLREAKKGSVAHLKLLVAICGLDKGTVEAEKVPHKGRNLEQILMDEWEKEA